MVWQASHWVKKVKTGNASRKSVLLCIAETSDPWGYAWDSVKTIAEEAEVSERQTRRILADLAGLGFLEVYQGRGARGQLLNLYRLCYNAKPADSLPEDHPSLSGRYRLFRYKKADPETDDQENPEERQPGWACPTLTRRPRWRSARSRR